MANVNVSEIITRAQQAADMEDDFISQSTWLYWANVEHKKLWTRLARSGYPVGWTDESITANGSLSYTISEPTAIIGVRGISSTGKYFNVPIVNPMSIDGQVGTTGTAQKCTIIHDNLNQNTAIGVRFWPIPSSGTYYVTVVNRPKKLVLTAPGADESTTVQLPHGWEERIVLGMARRALGKEETINPAIETEIRDVDLFIEDSVRSFLLRDQPTVHDMNEPTYGQLPPYTEWFYV